MVMESLVNSFNKWSTPEDEVALFMGFAEKVGKMSNGEVNVNFESQGRTELLSNGRLGAYKDNHGTYGSEDAKETLNVIIIRNGDEAEVRLGHPNQPLTEESLRPAVVSALMKSGYTDISTEHDLALYDIEGDNLSGNNLRSLQNSDIHVQGIKQWKDVAQKLIEGKLDGVSGRELLEQNPEGLIDSDLIKGTYSTKGAKYEEIESLNDIRDPTNAGLGYKAMIEYAQDKIVAERYNELLDDMVKSEDYKDMSSDQIIQNTFDLHQQTVAELSSNNLAFKAYEDLESQYDGYIEDSAMEEGLKQAAKLYYDEHPEQLPQTSELAIEGTTLTNKM